MALRLDRFPILRALLVDSNGNPASAGSNVPVPLPVTDNGGSLTVDGSVAVSAVGGTVTVATHAVTQSGTWTVNPPSGTAHNVVTTASTNFAVLVATATSLDEITVSNPTATPAFVKLYNKSTAPTASDVPVATIPIAANSFWFGNFGNTGKRFGTGLGIGVTGAIAANDATATVAGIVVNLTRH